MERYGVIMMTGCLHQISWKPNIKFFYGWNRLKQTQTRIAWQQHVITRPPKKVLLLNMTVWLLEERR